MGTAPAEDGINERIYEEYSRSRELNLVPRYTIGIYGYMRYAY